MVVPGLGELTRLRTWDLFERLIPPHSRVIDVGGGSGMHAAFLARQGHDVVLYDPVPRHLEHAGGLAGSQSHGFQVVQGIATSLPEGDASADVALLLGPFYHLPELVDRHTAVGVPHEVAGPRDAARSPAVADIRGMGPCAGVLADRPAAASLTRE